MIKNFKKELNSEYFSEIYDYKGQWDLPSRCGIKIFSAGNQTVVIATELYAENPGTSVTNFCAPLANLICNDFNIPREKLLFIVHTPDSKSKLSFLNEFFYKVSFSLQDGNFSQPVWEQIEKQYVDNLIQQSLA
jgi:hypothetical protein